MAGLGAGEAPDHRSTDTLDIEGSKSNFTKARSGVPALEPIFEIDKASWGTDRRNEETASNNAATGRGCGLVESGLHRPQEGRFSPFSDRLSKVKPLHETHSLQNANTGVHVTTDGEGRLCNYVGPHECLLFNTYGGEREGLSGLSFPEQGLYFSGSPFRSTRCSSHVHSDNAGGHQADQTEMEVEGVGLPRRHYSSTQGQDRTRQDNEGGDNLHGIARFHYQQGKKQGVSVSDIYIPRMVLRYENHESETVTEESRGIVQAVQLHVEENTRQKDGAPSTLSFPDRQTERPPFCVQGRLPLYSQALRSPQAPAASGGLEQGGQGSVKSPVGPPSVGSKTEAQRVERIREADNRICSTHDRCIPDGGRGSATYQWPLSIFHAQIQGEGFEPIFEFQGAQGSIFLPDAGPPGAQAMQDSCVTTKIRQHHSGLLSRAATGLSQSTPAPKEDRENHGSRRVDSTPGASAGGAERRGRCAFEVGAGRRLLNQPGDSREHLSETSLQTDGRCLRVETQCKVPAMVRAGEPSIGRRTPPLMDGGEAPAPPPDSPHPTCPAQVARRKGSGPHPPASLGGSSLGASTTGSESDRAYLSGRLQDPDRGPHDEAGRGQATTRALSSCPDPDKCREGEQWFDALLRRIGVGEELIELGHTALAPATWSQYCWTYYWIAPVYDQIVDTDPTTFTDWAEKSERVIMELEQRGRTPGSLIIARNALSYISRIGFQHRLAERETIGLLTRRIKRKRGVRPGPDTIWNPEIVIDYYMNYKDNTRMNPEELTIKCILLTCLFTACRPGELATISMGESRWFDDYLRLSIQSKTSTSRTFLTIRKLESSRVKVCPFSVIHFLWFTMQRCKSGADTIFVGTTGKPINAKGIYYRLRQGFEKVGVPAYYRPYSIKRAAISYLVHKGATLHDAAQYARLSTSSGTVFRYYFQSDRADQLTQMMSAGSHSNLQDHDEEASRDYLEL